MFIEREIIQKEAISNIILPKFFVFFNVISPNSIALLPPEI